MSTVQSTLLVYACVGGGKHDVLAELGRLLHYLSNALLGVGWWQMTNYRSACAFYLSSMMAFYASRSTEQRMVRRIGWVFEALKRSRGVWTMSERDTRESKHGVFCQAVEYSWQV